MTIEEDMFKISKPGDIASRRRENETKSIRTIIREYTDKGVKSDVGSAEERDSREYRQRRQI